jgi:hypothetical protein
MTKEQSDEMKTIENMESNLARSGPADTDMDIDNAIQESMPWTKVTNKKDGKVEPNENTDSTMKKVRVTLTIRSTKNNDFNPAKLHIDMFHELHKFDESLIVFNTNGDNKVNIESSISATRYKELFKPMEKAHKNGIVTVSISHYIFITEKAGSSKEAIFPFLKKNKIFIYFNPKPGLEHFTAIGVLFGPNPDYIWRDELADLLIDTMSPEITTEETKIMGYTEDGKPKILLSLNIQTIGTSKPTETTSVVLEVRVPTGQERTYTTIIERLYEKSEEEKIIIPTKLGKFFPYYMKPKLPDTFTFLMRQQNAEMMDSTIIPVFGYTPAARKKQINVDGEDTTVELAMATTKNILRIEATPSTWNLHKYLIIVKKEHKDSVQKFIRSLFRKITGTLENQPENFPLPRCGGRETAEIQQMQDGPTPMNSYMVRLETLALAQNPQDAGPPEPPKRHRKITISYAGAVRSGILKPASIPNKEKTSSSESQSPTDETTDTQSSNENSNSSQRQVSWDSSTADTNRSMGSSLSRSITNSKIQSFKKDIDTELKEIKSSLDNQMNKQEEQMSEIIDIIHTMNKNMERRVAQAVLETLIKEKLKVQELTHGQVYDASHAPLADENGILPFGAKAQAGGPLDCLHHVEVTVQHMASVLDSIADHLQKDPSARHLFNDDESETPTTIITSPNNLSNRNNNNNENSTDEDVEMVARDYGGTKRLHGTAQSPAKHHQNNDPDNPTSPQQRTPPSKRECRANKKPSAQPDGNARERGET